MTGTLDISHRLQLEEISEKLFVSISGKDGRANTAVGKKEIFLLLGEIKYQLYKFDVTESKCGNRNVLSPTTFKGETFKFKNYVFNKKD